MITVQASSTPVVAVEYIIKGERSAAAVARGDSHLQAIVLVEPGGQPHVIRSPNDQAFHVFRTSHRIYFDAVFGRTVELRHSLPPPVSFDDARAMLALLGEPEHKAEESLAVDNAIARARNVMQIALQLRARLHQEPLKSVYGNIELPVVGPTAAMIRNGIRVDVGALERLRADHSAQMDHCQRQICQLTNRQFNLASDEEIRPYLFCELGLPSTISTKRGLASTGKLALERLLGQHPAVEIVKNYRQSQAVLQATNALLNHRSPITGRVHANLDPLGASTGRFSCDHPNLQAIAAAVRLALVAEPGHLLIELDFSQAELRVLAHLSRDPGLIWAFEQGIDVHNQAASAIFGGGPEEVAPAQRKIGKAVNFGIVFGQTEYGLSDNLGIPVEQARSFIANYFRRYQGVLAWIQQVQYEVQRTGFVSTLFGRIRALPELFSPGYGGTDHGLRCAVNSIVQGTAADFMKLAIVRLHAILPSDCRMILTVHDSVLIEVPTSRVSELTPIFRQAMEQTPPGFAVPLVVDAKAGPNWGQLTPVPRTMP